MARSASTDVMNDDRARSLPSPGAAHATGRNLTATRRGALAFPQPIEEAAEAADHACLPCHPLISASIRYGRNRPAADACGDRLRDGLRLTGNLGETGLAPKQPSAVRDQDVGYVEGYGGVREQHRAQHRRTVVPPDGSERLAEMHDVPLLTAQR